MATRRIAVIVLRLAFAFAAMLAVFVQLFGITVRYDLGVVNFFSYFTILSNILASVIFIVSAVRLIQARESSERDVAIRGASVVYMVFVGVVFSTLLRDVDLGALLPWVNVIHHYLMPIVVLVDWIVWPPQKKLEWSVIPLWMIFPVVYLVYSLIRGAITGFYAYPFFDPSLSGGYGGVTLYCLAMLVGFAVIAVGVRALGNWRARPLQDA